MIRDLKPKYGGMLRYICSIDLQAREVISPDSVVEVGSLEFEKQKEMLEGGRYGFHQDRRNGSNIMQFDGTHINYDINH